MVGLRKPLTRAAVAVAAALAVFDGVARADVIIGNWESGTPEGWIDWGNGQAPLAPPRHQFNNIGATVGNTALHFGVNVNAEGFNVANLGNPEHVAPFTGYNGGGGNSFNPQLLLGTQTSTWTWDVSRLHDGNAANGEIVANPNWIELIFDTFSNGGVDFHIDNVRLVQIPEPASLACVSLPALGLERPRRRGGRNR